MQDTASRLKKNPILPENRILESMDDVLGVICIG